MASCDTDAEMESLVLRLRLAVILGVELKDKLAWSLLSDVVSLGVKVLVVDVLGTPDIVVLVLNEAACVLDLLNVSDFEK